MVTNIYTTRVRYAETDQMGYMHHGNYAQYFEIGRTELMRSLGLSYAEMESQGIIMPVIQMNTKFLRPAKYDDLITITTKLKEIPASRAIFYYTITNQAGEILTEAETTLVFVNAQTRRPMRAPKEFTEKLAKSVNSIYPNS